MVAAFAPGRVNLVGEHTDHQEGLCLPFAVARGVTVRAEARPGAEVVALAEDLGEEDRFALAAPSPARGWRAYVRGCVAELRAAGHPVPAARLAVHGDVPRGGGLASSAALEVAVCLALLALGGERAPDRRALAALCQRVEHRWVGAQTGPLDQLASLCGLAGHALRLDCRTLALAPVPLALGAWRLVVVDSGVAHEHATGAYEDRRVECAAAAHALGLAALRDATPADLARLEDPLRRRARHVVSENARVDEAVGALRGGDLPALGRVLDASHASLRDDLGASVPAVEALVARLRGAGAAGARMVGGGFGGHVLALFPPGANPPADALVVTPSPGAGLLPPAD